MEKKAEKGIVILIWSIFPSAVVFVFGWKKKKKKAINEMCGG
jgi:hypothetical protein